MDNAEPAKTGVEVLTDNDMAFLAAFVQEGKGTLSKTLENEPADSLEVRKDKDGDMCLVAFESAVLAYRSEGFRRQGFTIQEGWVPYADKFPYFEQALGEIKRICKREGLNCSVSPMAYTVAGWQGLDRDNLGSRIDLPRSWDELDGPIPFLDNKIEAYRDGKSESETASQPEPFVSF
jgi:hypothetical protein